MDVYGRELVRVKRLVCPFAQEDRVRGIGRETVLLRGSY